MKIAIMTMHGVHTCTLLTQCPQIISNHHFNEHHYVHLHAPKTGNVSSAPIQYKQLLENALDVTWIDIYIVFSIIFSIVHIPHIWLHQSTIKNAIYLSVNVIKCSTKALNIGDTIFKSPTGEGPAVSHGHLSHGRAGRLQCKGYAFISQLF